MCGWKCAVIVVHSKKKLRNHIWDYENLAFLKIKKKEYGNLVNNSVNKQVYLCKKIEQVYLIFYRFI